MVAGLLGNESSDSNRFTLVTPKSENDVRLQAKLDSKNPTGLPVGVVSNGHLVEGKSSIAGQNCFMPFTNHEDYKNRRSMKGRSKRLVLELQNIIGMLNPEAIVICAQGIDQHYVEEELLKIFKMSDMPHLIYIDDYIDEVMLGMESISKDSLFDKISR